MKKIFVAVFVALSFATGICADSLMPPEPGESSPESVADSLMPAEPVTGDDKEVVPDSASESEDVSASQTSLRTYGIHELLTPEKIGHEEFERHGIADMIAAGKFSKHEIGDRIVCFHQRRVGAAIVEKDFLNYQFDRHTGEFIERNGGWRDDLPETLPADMLTLEEALAESDAVRGEVLSGTLYFISPDSSVFPLDPAPENPCWAIYGVGERGHLVLTVIDAVTGEFLGNGIPPPGGESTVMPGDGRMISDDLRIAAQIRTDHGIIDAPFRKGGEETTARGDRVVWGHFHADPAHVSWGSGGNPEVYVKVWHDITGRLDVNFFHVSVPEITVFSACPWDGATYHHITPLTTTDRHVRHEYWPGR